MPGRKRFSCFATGAVALFGFATISHGGVVTIDRTLKTGFDGLNLANPYQLGDTFGRVSKNNLLISLSAFDVDAGETVNFTSRLPLKNVITRVTGGRASRINGTINSRVSGANLFLINPSGLVVGPGATFNVSGGLHLSTADAIDFADGARLSARGGDVPVLSTAAPAAFGFLAPPAPIRLDRVSVPDAAVAVGGGNVLSLSGGDITILGSSLSATGGAIGIHSGATVGRVTVPAAGDPGSARFARGGVVRVAPASGARGSVVSNLTANRGGHLRVTGGDVSLHAAVVTADAGAVTGAIELLADRALLLGDATGVRSSAALAASPAAIRLHAPSVTLEGLTNVVSNILPASTATAGGAGISIRGDVVTLRSEAQIQSSTATRANGPPVRIHAARSLTIQGDLTKQNPFLTGVKTETLSDAATAGRGGDLIVDGGAIFALEEGEIDTRTLGAGRSGDVIIRGDSFTADANGGGFTGVESRVGLGSTGGSGGTIDLRVTGDVLLRRGGVLTATTFGEGDGGSVIVRARNVRATETGPGNVDPDTGERFNGVFARSAIRDEAATNGGRAGAITITADDQILLAGGSQAGVSAVRSTAGAGDVTLTAPRITVTAARVTAESSAGGGNVRISGQTIVVNDSAVLNASAQGDGGTFTIAPAGVVVLGGGSSILAVGKGLPVRTFIDPTATFIKSPDAVINAQNPVLPPDVDVTAGLLSFNVAFADASRKLQQDCLSAGLTNFSSFTIEPRGGVAAPAAGR
jgi:filamentous hemagglutinin family protein